MHGLHPLPTWLPLSSALALAWLRGWRCWFDPAVRGPARATAEAIVGRGGHVDRVARAHLATTATREELVLRPAQNLGSPVAGIDHVRAAQAQGRGVIVGHCHHGPFSGFSASVARHLPGMTAVVGDWMLGDQPDPDARRRQLAWRAPLEETGARLVGAAGSYATIEQRLGEGAVVTNAFDMPGRHETRFLGRPAMFATGTARLAAATGALLIPGRRIMHRWRPLTVLGPAIDPHDFGGWEDLHQALADHYGEQICSSPAWLEDPRRGGAWEAGATAEAWLLPPRAEPATI